MFDYRRWLPERFRVWTQKWGIFYRGKAKQVLGANMYIVTQQWGSYVFHLVPVLLYLYIIYIIIICYDVFFCDIFRFGHGSKIVGWFHAFGVLFVCCPVMLDRCFVGGVPDFSSLTEATVLETSATSSHRGLSRSGVAGAKEVWLRWDFKVNVKQMMV